MYLKIPAIHGFFKFILSNEFDFIYIIPEYLVISY